MYIIIIYAGIADIIVCVCLSIYVVQPRAKFPMTLITVIGKPISGIAFESSARSSIWRSQRRATIIITPCVCVHNNIVISRTPLRDEKNENLIEFFKYSDCELAEFAILIRNVIFYSDNALLEKKKITILNNARNVGESGSECISIGILLNHL